jgi:hypothetical protein
MDSKTFTKHFNAMETARDAMDAHVWKIFDRYIAVTGIHFNGPEDWYVDGGFVHYYGDDGCMGCYDNVNEAIPLEYFIDTENAFARLEAKIAQDRADAEEAKRVVQEEKDRKEFERLKAKLGSEA